MSTSQRTVSVTGGQRSGAGGLRCVDSAEVLRRWWPAGSDWETPAAEVDPRVGGRLRLVIRSPEGVMGR